MTLVQCDNSEFLPIPPRPKLNTSPTDIPLGLNLDRLVNQLSEYALCLTKFSSPDRGLPEAGDIVTCTTLLLKNLLSSSTFRANPDNPNQVGKPKHPSRRPKRPSKGDQSGPRQIIKIIRPPESKEKPEPKIEVQQNQTQSQTIKENDE